VSLFVEAAEKVPGQILRRDAEKSDIIECAITNDLMLAKGQDPPQKKPSHNGSEEIFLQAR
jgi:hypothetical protein